MGQDRGCDGPSCAPPQDDRYVLRVQLEETLLSGVAVASYEVNMTCPQPADYETVAATSLRGQLEPVRGNGVHQSQAEVLVPQAGLLQHVSQSALAVPGPQLPPRPPRDQAHPVAQTQPALGLQRQPSLGLPGLQPHNQAGAARPLTQPQPSFIRPALQPQNQHGAVHPGGQNRPGLLRPGLQLQNQPGLLHPGAQTQPGLLRPGLQLQHQPGLVPPALQPGSVHAGAQTQAGFSRPGLQPQSQAGSVLPSLQSHAHAGLIHPSLQSQAGLLQHGQPRPGLLRPALAPRPGLVRPGLQPQAQPGLLHPGLHPQPGLLRPTALFYPSAGAGGSWGWDGGCSRGVGIV